MHVNNQQLQEFINQILFLQNKKNEHLTEADYREVAVNLGMNDSELKDIFNQYDAYYHRGTGFLKSERLSDAIKELNIAVTLNPWKAEAHYQLALAYEKSWLQSNSPEILNKAIHFAHRCLELNPKHPQTYQLLNDIERKKISVPIDTQKDRYENLAYIMAAILLILSLLVVILLLA